MIDEAGSGDSGTEYADKRNFGQIEVLEVRYQEVTRFLNYHV
jgi:hypothetical protein